MDVETFYNMLKKNQEPKGYFFNKDNESVADLLSALLFNKERYGYTACPCRLASGNREKDKDIICPCAYRKRDVREFNSCFCNLYVTKEWNEGTVARAYVPERRPPEKMF